MRVSIFILLFIGLTFFCFSQNWELKKNKNDIKVYTRELDSTKINEYKAVLIANTTKEKALKIIIDGDNLWKWNHKTSQSKTIKKISETEFVFWMKNDLPWPIKDRDNAIHAKVFFLEKNRIKVSLLPDKFESVTETDDCIRITNFKGYWLIEPQNNNQIKITQQLYGDPNGNLPSWLLNSMLTNVPYQSFTSLKEILEN